MQKLVIDRKIGDQVKRDRSQQIGIPYGTGDSELSRWDDQKIIGEDGKPSCRLVNNNVRWAADGQRKRGSSSPYMGVAPWHELQCIGRKFEHKTLLRQAFNHRYGFANKFWNKFNRFGC